MTGTDIREALRAVADTTATRVPDRLALQRLVRRERRRRAAGRLALGAAAVTVAAVAVTALGALPSDDEVPPSVTPEVVGTADLQAPVYVVADARLVSVDPQGGVADLGPAEEVVGWSTESVWYVDAASALVRRDLSTGDEGPGGWRWSEATTVVAPVQSAQVSADGRYLGWVDLRERLHVQDLKAGSTAEPVLLKGSGHLVDLAQGSGTPLVADDRGLVLLTPDGPVSVPGSSRAWDSSATRERVAVVGPDETAVFQVDGSRVRSLDTVPGYAKLSPYGDVLAAVAADRAVLWPGTGEPVPLEVPGDASRVAWGDDDTVLVSTFLDREVGVYACDVATAGDPCAALDLGGDARSVRLSR